MTHPYVHDFSLMFTSGKNHLEEIPMSSGGESLSYFPLFFKEALHFG